MALPAEFATDVAVATQNAVAGDVADLYFGSRNLLMTLMARGKVVYQGGDKIVRPIEYRGNPNIQWSDKNTVLNVAEQDVLTAAFDDWKVQTGTVVINDIDPEINKGPDAALSYVDVQLANLNKSAEADLERSIVQDGATLRTNGMNSLGRLVGAHVNENICGLNPTTESWWTSYRTADRGASTTMTRPYISAMQKSISRGSSLRPDLAVTVPTVYGEIEQLLFNIERVQPSRVNGLDLNIEGFMHEKMLFIWTDNESIEKTTNAAGVETASTRKNPLYMLNLAFLALVCHETMFLSMVRPVRNETKLKTFLLLETMCQLMCWGRKYQGASWQTK